jgi:hypothetical protein
VKDELEKKLDAAKVDVRAFEEILQETYEMEGEPYASVKNPVAFRKWVREQPGLEQRMTLPWTTTNSITKEMLLDGDEPPPGVEVFVKQKTRLAR